VTATRFRKSSYTVTVEWSSSTLKHFTIFILACGAVWTARAQEAKPNFPSALPGKGLAQHDFFYAGESKSQDMYILRNGKIAWEFHDPAGKGEISDAILLSNESNHATTD